MVEELFPFFYNLDTDVTTDVLQSPFGNEALTPEGAEIFRNRTIPLSLSVRFQSLLPPRLGSEHTSPLDNEEQATTTIIHYFHQPTPTPTSSSGFSIEEALAAHNSYRRSHNAPNLQWDQNLATYALHHAQKCKFEHSGGKVRRVYEPDHRTTRGKYRVRLSQSHCP